MSDISSPGGARLHGPIAETPDGDLQDYGDHPDYPLVSREAHARRAVSDAVDALSGLYAGEVSRLRAALEEIAQREWRDEGGRIAAALARDGLAGTGRFAR